MFLKIYLVIKNSFLCPDRIEAVLILFSPLEEDTQSFVSLFNTLNLDGKAITRNLDCKFVSIVIINFPFWW